MAMKTQEPTTTNQQLDKTDIRKGSRKLDKSVVWGRTEHYFFNEMVC